MYVVRLFFHFVLTLLMFAIACVLGVALWQTYMLAPWTRDGRVLADVVDVAPEVSGTVVDVPVHDNQSVHKGDVLFVIDPSRFRLAIAQAQAQVDTAKQQEMLRESDVRRRRGLTGIVSAEEQENMTSSAAIASAALAGAQASLDIAKLNLERSVLRAPVTGYVTHLRLRPGDYASAGQPRVAVIDAASFWIEGYFEETKLDHIHVGDPARMMLMGYDAPLFGHVESIGRGVSVPNDLVNNLGLPTVNPTFTWVRLAARIPVRIAIDQVPPNVVLSAGMTASVDVGNETKTDATPRGRLLSWLKDNL
jgi:multidrug resistance efflux pump